MLLSPVCRSGSATSGYGGCLNSQSGVYKLCMQPDGNLVLYNKNWAAIWCVLAYGQHNSGLLIADNGGHQGAPVHVVLVLVSAMTAHTVIIERLTATRMPIPVIDQTLWLWPEDDEECAGCC